MSIDVAYYKVGVARSAAHQPFVNAEINFNKFETRSRRRLCRHRHIENAVFCGNTHAKLWPLVEALQLYAESHWLK